jgi:hypothetical protein
VSDVETFRHVDARSKFPEVGMDSHIAFSIVVYIYSDDACLLFEFYRLEVCNVGTQCEGRVRDVWQDGSGAELVIT